MKDLIAVASITVTWAGMLGAITGYFLGLWSLAISVPLSLIVGVCLGSLVARTQESK